MHERKTTTLGTLEVQYSPNLPRFGKIFEWQHDWTAMVMRYGVVMVVLDMIWNHMPWRSLQTCIYIPSPIPVHLWGLKISQSLLKSSGRMAHQKSKSLSMLEVVQKSLRCWSFSIFWLSIQGFELFDIAPLKTNMYLQNDGWKINFSLKMLPWHLNFRGVFVWQVIPFDTTIPCGVNRTAVDRLHGRKGYLAQLMDTVRPWAGRFDAEILSLTKRKMVM